MDVSTKNEMIILIEKVKSIVISAINSNGIPIIKSVTKLGNDDLNSLYFCTSPDSDFWKWYVKNPKTSVLLFDDDPNIHYPSADEKYYSLSLIGQMEVVLDVETKQRFFSDYLAAFFPDGVNDKNYHLIRFVVQSGKYYRGVTDNFLSIDFTSDELVN